jgi:hypothetical protein
MILGIALTMTRATLKFPPEKIRGLPYERVIKLLAPQCRGLNQFRRAEEENVISVFLHTHGRNGTT